MDSIKGYKTVGFFVLAFLIALANLVGFAGFELSAEQSEWIGLVVPLVGLILRTITDSPVFKNK